MNSDKKSFFCLDAPHGSPSADITHRHVGDLGNITTDASGTAVIDMQDPIIQLYNATQSILNRTVVVHLLRDDGGLAGTNDSITTGYDKMYFLINII
jgi:Cu-Zn family superoxide dismutase